MIGVKLSSAVYPEQKNIREDNFYFPGTTILK